MIENGLTQLVNEYTREITILDQVFTDCNDSVVDAMVCKPFSTSDHSMTWFHLMLSGRLNPPHVIEPEAQFRPNYARADWDAVNLALSTVNWHALVNESVSIETAWHSFYKCINDVISIAIPKKSQRRRESKYIRYPKSLKRLRSIKLAKWRALKGYYGDAQLKVSYKAAAANFN